MEKLNEYIESKISASKETTFSSVVRVYESQAFGAVELFSLEHPEKEKEAKEKWQYIDHPRFSYLALMKS